MRVCLTDWLAEDSLRHDARDRALTDAEQYELNGSPQEWRVVGNISNLRACVWGGGRTGSESLLSLLTELLLTPLYPSLLFFFTSRCGVDVWVGGGRDVTYRPWCLEHSLCMTRVLEAWLLGFPPLFSNI